MIARSVHHVSFAVADLEGSMAFYEGLLGLTRIDRPDMGIPGVWFAAGTAEIHLIEHAESAGGPAKKSPLSNHCAFAIDDLDETMEDLEAIGVDLVAANPEFGQCWIEDPDGNVIELVAPQG